jgi:hydrogenase maturation protease
METTAAILLLGYGNTLRGDDGVGPKLAEAVGGLNLAGVEARSCALLTPELAEPIARARRVVFVDAAMDGSPQVECRPLAAGKSSHVLAHAVEPATLLALARDVFGRAPQAWLVTIPIETVELGEALSPLAQAGLRTALAWVRRFTESRQPT